MENFEYYLNKGAELGVVYAPKLLLAIVTLLVGLWIIKIIVKSIARVMEKKGVDPSLAPFLKSITGVLLKVMLIICIAGMIGIQMTSFIAILGAAGLAIGLALSGTFQNFAGGVMLLIFKPFNVGDLIEAQGFAGVVSEIQIFNTILKTPDNRTVIIPNAPLSTGPMVNFSTESQRRVDLVFGISYNDNIDKAKAVIQKIIDADSRILKDPVSFIALKELADSSVNFVVRAWVNSADYWGVFFDMQECVKKTFDKEKISIPYPQMDVYVNQTAT
jgi:small conductance mechanosensitive channel